jgi:tetratricopeptide (TPR) repeat protein
MSVGVMPWAVPVGNPAVAQRMESLVRDLTSQLARADVAIRAVPVPTPPSGMAVGDGVGALARSIDVRYVLEGDARPGPDATEIRLRLISGASGQQIWSETVFLKEPAAAADQMRSLRTAMEHLRSRLFEVEIGRATAALAGATTAMDYVLRARALDQGDKSLDRFRRQQALYEQALQRDHDLVPALLGLYYVLDGQLDVDTSVDRDRLIRRMDEVTLRAVNLNRAAPETWSARSGALMYMGRWDAALEASQKAIQLDPDAAWLVAGRAWLMSLAGRPAEAVVLVAHAIAMDPPGSWWTIRVGCEAHLLLGQYEDAIAACEKALGQAGEEFDIASFLAAADAHQGATERAAEEKAKISRRSPRFSIATVKAKRYSVHPQYMRLAEAHWYSGLRKAGIPEE